MEVILVVACVSLGILALLLNRYQEKKINEAYGALEDYLMVKIRDDYKSYAKDRAIKIMEEGKK